MKTRILEFLSKIKEFIKRICVNFKNKTVESFKKCKQGEEKMKNILLYWSVIPCILYIYLSYRVFLPKFIYLILNAIILVLTVLDFYFIQKAVKIHPEYDSELMEELEKSAYYSTLDEKQLKKAKKIDNLNKGKNFVKGLFNIGKTKKVDFFKIVRAFLILVFLIALKRTIF